MVADGNLSVALNWQFSQSLMLSVPSWHHVQLVHGNHLRLLVAGKGVIYSQSLVYEIIVKVLRLDCAGRQQHRHGGEG